MNNTENSALNTSGKWAPLGADQKDSEKIWAKSRTFGQDVWFRFRKKPAAFISLIILLLVGLFAFVGPALTPYNYSQQQLALANIPPVLDAVSLEGYENKFFITSNIKIIEITPAGGLVRQLDKVKDNLDQKQSVFLYAEGQEIVLDFSVKPSRLLNGEGVASSSTEKIWNKNYILGTDHLGRDILTRLMYGCRISLIVAVVAAMANMVIGTIYGGISGYFGGKVDAIMMRIVDIISTIPLTLYVILIKVVLSNDGLLSIIVALASVYWVNMARVVRGQVLSLKSQEFVTASRTIGTGTRDILMRHLVPNAMGPILVTVTMLIPSAIFMEAFMSYIGIGIAPPMASLGTMCNDATESLRSTPYQLLMPALLICIIMFAFNFLGDGLRDALDPKLKK